MTGEFDRLRGAMTDLAEHGGSPDLYDRALRTSRRLGRRTALAVGSAAVATIVAVATGVALAGSPKAAPPPPIAPSPSVTPSSPAPEPPTTPTTTPPTTRARTPATTKLPRNGCPVTAATLDRVPGLPDGYRHTPDTVDCWRNWASAWDRGQEGDGMNLFRYNSTVGWRLHGQGSSFSCASLGIEIDPGDPPPFCF
ncbi:MAG: hypothetical protein ABW022_08615 [Actinoplanes sp.]